MFPDHPHCFRAAKLLLGALIFLHACSCALSSIGETCYSRQHRDTIVNVRKALDYQKAVMDVRKIEAERDCILACCSEEIKPGIKCNMVMYKPSSQDGNCYLFYCKTEQDCPLMSAQPGTNTYDIFKGMTHPSAKVKERLTTMPVTITKPPSTTHPMSTTGKPTTTMPTTTTSTTQSTTTTSPTTTTTTSIAPTELAIILLTMPSETAPTTTTSTTTTPSTTTTTTAKLPYNTISSTTTTHLIEPTVKSSKKQTRPPKKSEPHGKSNTTQKQATQKTVVPVTTTTSTTTNKPTTPTTTPTTTTTTTTTTPSTTTTTTTTTTTPSTTTTTTTTTSSTTTTTTSSTTTTTITTTPSTTTTTPSTSTTERTTIVMVDMDSDVKNRDSVPAGASASDKAKESHLMWKNGLAFLVVLTLIILTFVVAVVGRRAMESFDRRHYTRLELNDLHYEI